MKASTTAKKKKKELAEGEPHCFMEVKKLLNFRLTVNAMENISVSPGRDSSGKQRGVMRNGQLRAHQEIREGYRKPGCLHKERQPQTCQQYQGSYRFRRARAGRRDVLLPKRRMYGDSGSLPTLRLTSTRRLKKQST